MLVLESEYTTVLVLCQRRVCTVLQSCLRKYVVNHLCTVSRISNCYPLFFKAMLGPRFLAEIVLNSLILMSY